MNKPTLAAVGLYSLILVSLVVCYIVFRPRTEQSQLTPPAIQPTTEQSPTTAAWMKSLPDQTPLAELSIPGTHNSAALHEPIRSTAQCQTLSIEQQLEAGVRFLDLRCRHLNDEFHLYHGIVDQRLSFSNCLATMADFLKRNPSETIIVSLKEEGQSKDNTRSFAETFLTYAQAEHWHLTPEIPKLGKSRGKLVLLRRFGSELPLGIDATNWKSHQHHATDQLIIQDFYSPETPEAKWLEFIKSSADKSPGKLHLNFTSAYLKRSFGVPDIRGISDPINQRLLDYLKDQTPPKKGIIIIDFITPSIAAEIIRLNGQ